MKTATSYCLTSILASGMATAGTADTLDHDLLADAEVRVRFQANGMSGHDGKFFLTSADGANRLNISGQTHFRYHLNFRNTTVPDEDLTNGFSVRRAKVGFDGEVGGEWQYKIVGAFSRDGGAFKLEDAVLSRKFDTGVELTWGQFKGPFMREENTSSKYQLAVDRSPMNEAFNQDRSQGLQLSYTGEIIRVKGMVNEGFKTGNTAYFSTKETDWALTGRVEFKFGKASWKTFKDFTSFREDDTGGLIGAGAHWQTMGETANTDTFSGTPATDMDMFSYTIDASYEGSGWNLYAAFVGRRTESTGGSDFDDFGALVQGGIFVTAQDEFFARWDAVFPDDTRSAGEDYHTLTFGGNHYFFPGSHAAKCTADVQWFLDDQVGSGDVVKVNEGIGLAPTSSDDQISIRFQMQLLF